MGKIIQVDFRSTSSPVRFSNKAGGQGGSIDRLRPSLQVHREIIVPDALSIPYQKLGCALRDGDYNAQQLNGMFNKTSGALLDVMYARSVCQTDAQAAKGLLVAADLRLKILKEGSREDRSIKLDAVKAALNSCADASGQLTVFNIREPVRANDHFSTEELPPDITAKLPKMIIGHRIRAIREFRKLAKYSLCHAAGIGSSTYAYIEDRDSLPSAYHLHGICKALKAAPERVITGMDFDSSVDAIKSDAGLLLFLRTQRGLSQDDLALAMLAAGFDNNGKSLASLRAAIAQWERGTHPQDEACRLLRKALDFENIFLAPIPKSPGAPPKKPHITKAARRRE